MKTSSRIILIVALCFIGFIFFWAIFSPKEQLSNRIYRTLKEQEKKADLTFKEATFEEVSAGIKYWQLVAQAAAANNSTQIVTLKEVHGTFFKNGNPVLRFQSPAALWDMKEKEIIFDQPIGYDNRLEGKISGLISKLKRSPLSIFNLPELYKGGAGYWFQSKNLSWKVADQKLLCTGGIVLNKGDLTGFAQQLSGDVALENVDLMGQPRFVIQPIDSSPITLEADNITLIRAADIIKAEGNPHVTWQTAKVSAQHMIFYERDKILHLSDKVKIDYDDIQAIGQAALYPVALGKITLTGRAQASQGSNNALSGDTVMVSLKEKQIAVIGQGKVIINEEEIK